MPKTKLEGSTDISPQNNTAKNVEGILDFNALQYECYPDLSVVVDRTHKNSPFHASTYGPGDTAYCVLNSGSDYINPRTSYLCFDVRAKGTLSTNFSFGWQGSAYNFIKTLRILDRAGNEIEYITDANVLANFQKKLKCSLDCHQTVGSCDRPISWSDDPYKSATGAKTRYCLLLRHMSGFFDYDQLMPAQVMSGLRIQITFESTERVAKWDTSVPAPATDDYIIYNPTIVLDSHKVTDSVARQLNMRSANDGLEIQFRTWFTSQFNVNSDTVNLESRRAVSRAFRSVLHYRTKPNEAAYATSEAAKDSMATDAASFTEYQWRAGNLYFPQQVLKAETPEALAVETLMHNFQLYGKTETPIDNPAHDLRDQTSAARSITVNMAQNNPDRGGLAIIGCNLERSSVQDVSGLPLNNSRVLAFNGKTSTSADREYRLFLQYLKIARVFMDNTELEE